MGASSRINGYTITYGVERAFRSSDWMVRICSSVGIDPQFCPIENKLLGAGDLALLGSICHPVRFACGADRPGLGLSLVREYRNEEKQKCEVLHCHSPERELFVC